MFKISFFKLNSFTFVGLTAADSAFKMKPFVSYLPFMSNSAIYFTLFSDIWKTSWRKEVCAISVTIEIYFGSYKVFRPIHWLFVNCFFQIFAEKSGHRRDSNLNRQSGRLVEHQTTISVTSWLNYLFHIGPFTTMKICPIS